MTAPTSGFAAALAAWGADYRAPHNIAHLKQHLKSLARQATPDAVIVAAEPYRDEPEIVAPLYEAVVEAQPDNARALVMLANAYHFLSEAGVERFRNHPHPTAEKIAGIFDDAIDEKINPDWEGMLLSHWTLALMRAVRADEDESAGG